MTPFRGRRRTQWRIDFGSALNVWAVGPWDRGEFAALREDLDPGRTWRKVPTLGASVDEIVHTEAAPEVVLLAQPRPGLDAQELVDRLQAEAPLTRVVVVAGSWCEGELRTGRPLVGVTRLYWHELPAWWRQSIARRNAGLAPHWSAVGDRRIDGAAALTTDGAPALIAVDALDFAVFDALSAALQPLGWQCTWTPRGRSVSHQATVGIWDGGQLDAAERESLRAFCGQFAASPAPVVALLDFPRVEHVGLVRDLGAGTLLGKPYRLDALVAQLAQVAQFDRRRAHERQGLRAAQ